MKFGLAPPFGRSSVTLEISEADFFSVRTARVAYLALLNIEEKFDIAIESYFDYERARVDLALRQMLTIHLPHSVLAADVRIINRKLLNLLAAAMLYDDQLVHDFCVLYGRNSAHWCRVKERRASLRASSLGYQVAEVVRDHIQHRGLPVDALFYQLTTKDAEGEWQIQVATDPHLAVGQLQADRKIPKELIDKLKQLGDRVPLTPLIKEYVGCLAELHKTVRDETSADGQDWVRQLRATLQRGREKFGQLGVVAAVALEEDGSRSESHQVFEDLLALRETLLEKNSLLTNLARRFVTAEHPMKRRLTPTVERTDTTQARSRRSPP
jgi:hypothetical protein